MTKNWKYSYLSQIAPTYILQNLEAPRFVLLFGPPGNENLRYYNILFSKIWTKISCGTLSYDKTRVCNSVCVSSLSESRKMLEVLIFCDSLKFGFHFQIWPLGRNDYRFIVDRRYATFAWK